MGKRNRHRLIVDDRGPQAKRFRFVPSCSCGKWTGLATASVDACNTRHRHDHLEREERVAGRTARGQRRTPTPRPVTPSEQLPEALR